MFVPFWWVGSTADSSMVNMKYVSRKIGEFSLTMLQNTKKVEKHERLMVYKAKDPKAAPLKNARIEPCAVDVDGASASSGEARLKCRHV